MTRSAAIMIVALVATMSFLGAAVADEQADKPQSSLPTPLIIVDEAAGTMTIALPVDGKLPECGDVSAAFDKSDGYGPGDCIEIVIEHPSGRTSHGAIVSAAAKELHPSTLDGIKKGEIMRWVAKTGGPGDGHGEEEPEPVDPSDGGDDQPNNGKSDEAPGQNPDKPGNGNNPGNKDNPGNGNGNGNGRDNPGNGNGNGNGPNG